MGKLKKMLESRHSDSSFRTASSSLSSVTKVPMSKQKKMKKKKQNYMKTHQNIRKVFDTLRQECSMYNTLCNDDEYDDLSSVSNVNDITTPGSSRCNDNSVILVNDTNKRKLTASPAVPPKKPRKETESVIVIDDSIVAKPAASKTPKKHSNEKSNVHCSTPINQNKDMKKLILSNFPQNNVSSTKKFNEEIQNLTKEINRDSYITIDLTAETVNNSARSSKDVIDLGEISDIDTDCTIVSPAHSKASLTLSGESNVTVLHKPKNNPSQNQLQLKKVFNGLAKLNTQEKSKMLEYLVQQILGGQCQLSESVKIMETKDASPQTAEDTYIKEVILGEKLSRNSIGSNIYNPKKDLQHKTGLRMIVIDGSNVAMEHGKGKVFSVKGLKICIEYFLRRGHVVKAFVPRYRCKQGKSSDPRLLDELERRGLVVYTPSRELQGRRITSYDDRYIVQCAAEFDGIIVSGDNYRDLLQENPRWRFVIENRLLPFTWVNDMIMFPRDPLGKNGPTLEKFLRHDDEPSTSKKTEKI